MLKVMIEVWNFTYCSSLFSTSLNIELHFVCEFLISYNSRFIQTNVKKIMWTTGLKNKSSLPPTTLYKSLWQDFVHKDTPCNNSTDLGVVLEKAILGRLFPFLTVMSEKEEKEEAIKKIQEIKPPWAFLSFYFQWISSNWISPGLT